MFQYPSVYLTVAKKHKYANKIPSTNQISNCQKNFRKNMIPLTKIL